MRDKTSVLNSFRKNQGEKYEVEEEAKDNPLQEYFHRIDDMDTEVAELKEKVEDICRLQSEIMSNPRNPKDQKVLLDEKLTDLRNRIRKVKEHLKKLEKETEETIRTGLVTDTQKRIRKIQFQKLSAQFVTIMERYSESQVTYRELCKTRIQKQLKIAGITDIDEEKVDDLVYSHEPQVFTQLMIRDTEEAKQMLNDVKVRHNEIIKLEEGIREIRDLFLEIDTLVSAQGEMVDSIEHNVGTAEVHIVDAKDNLGGAREKAKSARKKKLCLAITGVVVIVILVIVLAVALS